MQIRFLLGPSGSGKTFRCLSEIRDALIASTDGLPLVLLAPKQATFQLERQLLADASLAGYTRLHILSFERFAHFVLDKLHKPVPRMLDEDGRLMVLRGLLSRHRDELKLFRGSARLAGFASQLSGILREFQQTGVTPDSLEAISAQVQETDGLSLKLQDMAMIYRAYLEWLRAHDVHDADCLLGAATSALNTSCRTSDSASKSESAETRVAVGGLWLDGFAELSAQELDFLAAVVPHCEHATICFCLDREPKENLSWLSHWSGVRRTFDEVRKRLEKLPEAHVSVELLPRDDRTSRFAGNPVLQHLEANWAQPKPYAEPATVTSSVSSGAASAHSAADPVHTLGVFLCRSPEAEAALAAREILRFVRAGGRYRDIAVIVRKLDSYHEALERTFSRYGIPLFLDRRESMSHHPFAELTRSALRTVAFDWPREDWIAALKTGFVPAEDAEIDWLENEALACGWQGATWLQPIRIPDQPELAQRLEGIRKRVVPPFQKLAVQMVACGNRPTGLQLAEALEEFWRALDIEQRLEAWADDRICAQESRLPGSVHLTMWDEMTGWLDNLKLAFAHEAMSLREWLPILEAGLANLSVGVIPPALDQVLIGAIDRSRNPDIKFALVLGMNEGVFPALPQLSSLLTDADRTELEKRNVLVGSSARQRLGRETYLAYIACTRARERIVLTCSTHDERGKPLNTSSILRQLRRLFPSIPFEKVSESRDWRDAEHVSELVVPLLELYSAGNEMQNRRILSLPGMAPLIAAVARFRTPEVTETISPDLAQRLYGPILRTSVSRIEQFAACPFRFFIHSGLRAEERRQFELDAREQGNFQHDALKLFHDQLREEKKRWRDITPHEARERMGRIAQALMAGYHDGLIQTSAQTRFTARMLTESLQEFVEMIVGWMREQYPLDPVAVEIAFDEGAEIPPWIIDLGGGHGLALHGRIDRVDIGCDSDSGEALAVIVDYKSSQKQLDSLLVANGIQLQLLAYLNVVANSTLPPDIERIRPVGAFYVNLRGKFDRASNRNEALTEPGHARKLAYQHSGRFDARYLRKLDSRKDALRGDQFNYRLNADGKIHGSSREAMSAAQFEALLASVKRNLEAMGRRIFSGVAGVDPYRKASTSACDQCEYQAICRIDPWTHSFRILSTNSEGED